MRHRRRVSRVEIPDAGVARELQPLLKASRLDSGETCFGRQDPICAIARLAYWISDQALTSELVRIPARPGRATATSQG
jgi:hypothetical protein